MILYIIHLDLVITGTIDVLEKIASGRVEKDAEQILLNDGESPIKAWNIESSRSEGDKADESSDKKRTLLERQ